MLEKKLRFLKKNDPIKEQIKGNLKIKHRATLHTLINL